MSTAFPASDARIRELAAAAARRQPLFAGPQAELPDRVAFQHVTRGNGQQIGRRFVERTATGLRIVQESPPPQAARQRYPCEERNRLDPVHRAAEALRKRQARLRRWLDCAEAFLHPCGQLYLWEWRTARRHRRAVRKPRRRCPEGPLLWTSMQTT